MHSVGVQVVLVVSRLRRCVAMDAGSIRVVWLDLADRVWVRLSVEVFWCGFRLQRREA